MDTLSLLNEAADRAEQMALICDGESEDYFAMMGIPDEDVVHDFVTHQAFKIFELRMALGGGVSIRNVSGVALAFGLTVGYQLALLREETTE